MENHVTKAIIANRKQVELWAKYLERHDESDYTSFDGSKDLAAAREIYRAYKSLLETLGRHVSQEWRSQ